MDKLFLRVYAELATALFIFGLLFRLLLSPHLNARLAQNIEETLAIPLRVTAELLAARQAEHHDIGPLLERAAKKLSCPILLLPRAPAEVQRAERARLDRGEVVRIGEPFSSRVFVRVAGTEQILRLGPLPIIYPLSGWRGFMAFLFLPSGLTFGVFLLLRPVRRRLTALSRAAAALGRGELSTRTAVGAADVIGALAQTFNSMAQDIERLVAAREELLHMTSHELRTPLQRLHFSIEKLRSISEPARAASAFDRMERDLLELDTLIEDLLTYARLDDRDLVTRGSSDVATQCRELCESLSELANGLVLAPPCAEMARAIPPIAVEPRLLRRALSNLIVNALRYARSRVEISVHEERASVLIRVDDDGPGIPLAEREHVFKPFVRRDDPRTQASRGTGLGLAIVRRIAERSGGQVSTDSAPLGGARFCLVFPTATL